MGKSSITNEALKELFVNREKIKECLEWLESYLSEKGGDEVDEDWDGQTPRELLIQVKLILERKE